MKQYQENRRSADARLVIKGVTMPFQRSISHQTRPISSILSWRLAGNSLLKPNAECSSDCKTLRIEACLLMRLQKTGFIRLQNTLMIPQFNFELGGYLFQAFAHSLVADKRVNDTMPIRLNREY